MYEYKFHKSLYRSQYNFCCPPMWNNRHMNFWIDYRVSKPLPICISSICVTFWSKGKKYILKTMIYFWSFLWFIMVTWVILGGFHSWPFFDLSLFFLSYRKNKLQSKMSFYILFALGAKSQRNSAYENWQWFWDPITYLKFIRQLVHKGVHKSYTGSWTTSLWAYPKISRLRRYKTLWMICTFYLNSVMFISINTHIVW